MHFLLTRIFPFPPLLYHDSFIIFLYCTVKYPPDCSEFTPRLIKELEGIKVTNVAAGLLHSACTDENGSAFMFGEKSINKMGFGGVRNATTPSIISEVPYAEEVACGGYHTCVVTRGGELYTWGSNENGCLGTDSTYVSHSPVRVEGPFLESTVSQVSCGWKHTAAISDNNVFTWGWGGSHGTFSVDGHSSGGQLGHGSDVDYARPAMVDLGKNVRAVHISCGFNHTAAVLEHF
jgi:alpha-tubulin suppressor-like RCC1 family protein